MTQLERMKEAARGAIRGDRAAQHQLDLVLLEAQNRPPLGVADGSVSEEVWTAFRDLNSALQQVKEAIARIRSVL